MKLYQILENQIKKEPNYVSDNGEIKKWVVHNKAQNFDEELIGLLLEDADLKEKFFVKVKDIRVFKQNLFIQFLEQKNYLNDSYTQFKNKVGLTIDGKHLKQRNEVSLVWPFKDCILEGGQSREEDKREEIFFNETLAQDEITELLDPKVLTNAKRFDKEGEHHFDQFNRDENGTITDNLIIKGNNLLALHSLKKEFAGKVKLIYIDPPYNTRTDANTFKYNNSFNHSSWLTFMKNRLEIAKLLLREDGIIFIDIDHYELFYLGIVADEVFGYENRLGVLAVVHNLKGRYNEFFSPAHENKIVYAKNISRAKIKEYSHDNSKDYPLEDDISKYKLVGLQRTGDGSKREDRPNLFYPIYYNPIDDLISLVENEGYIKILPIDDSGTERRWRWGKEKVLSEWRTELTVKKIQGSYKIYSKIRIKGDKPKSLWMKPEYSGTTATNDLKQLLGDKFFSYPKSIELVKDSIQISTDENDIILDFFGGSGTTAHAVLQLNKEDGGNRQFILCEQMDYVETITAKRAYKVIEQNQSNSFVYLELKKYNQTFIEKIEEAKEEKTLLQIWEEMKAKSFLNYNVDIQKQEQHIEDFRTLSLQKQKQHLCELLDKNQLYVNLSSLNDKNFECTLEEQKVTREFYQLKN
ncbi:DNA methyltransferase [Chryseobacterium arthrosphaerae]|uniref:DNA methyltransferase n=1 Tax=Chryseobacterium arthrosphaerae TaxID=651561 RepID=UPI003D33A43E